MGRLDRLGRRSPVEIVYFRCAGSRPDLARLYERLELFARASAGIDAALGGVGEAIARAQRAGTELDAEALAAEVARARHDTSRDVSAVFYPDSYDPRRAHDILAQVPAMLEPETERFCVDYAEQLGIDVVEKGGRACYHFACGDFAEVERLPGAARRAHYGTFDREEALDDPRLELFAGSHELVEGLLGHLTDTGRGQAAVLELPAAQAGSGFVALCRDAHRARLHVYDRDGQARPEWREAVRRGLSRARTLGNRHRDPPPGLREETDRIARTLEQHRPPGELAGVALFFFRSEG